MNIARGSLLAMLTASVVSAEVVLKLNSTNVHWGYFSKTLKPVLSIDSGSTITVEMATHHACDDYDKMIKGDPGMEDIFKWTPTAKNKPFRGKSGSGDGVH